MALLPQEQNLDDIAKNLIVNPNADEDTNSNPQDEGPDDQDRDEDPEQDAQALQDDGDEDRDDAGNPLEDEDVDEELEADADDYDEEDDNNEEFDDDDIDDQSEVFQIKADGKTHQVTLDELKRSYSGQQAINNRLKAAADAKREAEMHQEQVGSLQQELVQARDAYLAGLEQVGEIIGDVDGENIDWDALYEQDRDEWRTQRELYRTRKEQKDALEAEKQRVHQQQQEEHRKQLNAFASEQVRMIEEHVPELMDKATGLKYRDELLEIAGEFGYQPEEVNGIIDHRPYRLLKYIRDIRKDGVKKVGKKTRSRRKKTVVRPGTGTQRVVQKSRQQKRVERLHARAADSGRAEDVAALMIERAKNGG